MSKVELIKKLQTQLAEQEEVLEDKILELSHEYDTQKYINEILVIARKSIDNFAEFMSNLTGQDKEKLIDLLRNMNLKDDEIENFFQEAKNLHNMKLRDFDIKGVPQYNRTKYLIETLYRRINEYNLTRNYKYTSKKQIAELKTYLNRVKQSKKYFQDGKLVQEISDIDEINYIIEKADIEEIEKTNIIYTIIEEKNKFYLEVKEGEDYVSETN